MTPVQACGSGPAAARTLLAGARVGDSRSIAAVADSGSRGAESARRVAVKLKETELARTHNAELACYASLQDERNAIERQA